MIHSGRLLISEPFLPDPNFRRAVVLLCEHSEEEGTLGFILNRPLKLRLEEVVDGFEGFNPSLYFGGPVQTDTLHYLHTLGNALEGSTEVADGVYWGGNFEALKVLAAGGGADPSCFRFFLGYAGWSAGQLPEEIEGKSWIMSGAHASHVFTDNPGELWRKVLRDMGGEYSVVANFPDEPTLN